MSFIFYSTKQKQKCFLKMALQGFLKSASTLSSIYIYLSIISKHFSVTLLL